VRYLVEPDRPEADMSDSRWVPPANHSTQRESVERAILRFRDQLQQRGIALLVMPVPGKPSVYPDQVTGRAAGKERQFRSPTLDLLDALQRQGVATVDLFGTFQAARESAGPLYLACDTHWTPRGAQIAAQATATKLGGMSLAPTNRKEFRTQHLTVKRWGDRMQIPGLRRDFAAETAECEQVLDPALGLLVPGASAQPGTYSYPGQQARVLVLGDSFCRIYQYAEPQSLGELPATSTAGAAADSGTKRLLPGSAGFISHLALALKSPVDAIVSDGGAATDVRRKLSTNPEILEGKQVVVWEFVERDIALGAQGWEEVALPRKLP
jgi:hypothetical protein